MTQMFSIGEFSKMSGMTIKSLRYYHEQRLLQPSFVDSGSGYRYYLESQLDTARVINRLRQLDFSIAEIRQILSHHQDDADIIAILESQRDAIQQRISRDRQIAQSIDQIILHEKEASQAMQESTFTIEEKQISTVLIASVRMQASYSECGKAFGQIGRRFGRVVCGKPMLLHHDTEYREQANFEACVPIKRGASTKDIQVKQLPGGHCLSLMHRGPYEDLGHAYQKLLKYIKSQGIEYDLPTREIYHKGPGMVFRGNPSKYLTEILFMISEET